MKTFEVYALNDPSYRGRTLVAAVMADRYQVAPIAGDYLVTFYRDTFFSTKPLSAALMISAFAVLDTEFSVSIEREPTQTRWSSIDSRELNDAVNAAVEKVEATKPRRKKSKDSLLDLT